MTIWDTLGQEKHLSITQNYYNNANAAIIMYDITHYDTFKEVDFWLNDIKAKLGNDYPIVYAIVGNKADLADQMMVPIEDAHKFAKTNGI